MIIEDKNKRITELPEADFLSFLYAERDREERLGAYQGWNIWAVVGALVTVVCASYTVLNRNKGSLDIRSVAYYVSGFLALLLCLRPLSMVKTRLRGVDYDKVKLLKDVVPKYHLYLALLSSVSFSILIPIIDKKQPWNIVTILWMILAIAYFITSILILVNKNGVVRSDLDGRLFVKIKCEQRFSALLGGTLSLIVLHSFTRTKGSFIGSPSFEIAVCIAAVVTLLYILAKIRKEIKSSEHLDVLLDDFLYKGRSKESVYQEILLYRMGYTVFGACFRELSEFKDSLESLDSHKKNIEIMSDSLVNGSFEITRLAEYLDNIQNEIVFSKELNMRLRALDNRLKQISDVDPDLEINAEYIQLLKMLSSLMKQSKELMISIADAEEKVLNWIKVFHCRKHGGWCLQECEERLEAPSLCYYYEIFKIKIRQRLSSTVRLRQPCKTHNLTFQK